MNIPFPIIYPGMIMPDWFNADRPYDDDAELTRLEEENKRWLNSIGKQYMKPIHIAKPKPPPAAQPESDDDVFIVPRHEEIVIDSEDSHEVEEEEEIPNSDSPPENNEVEMESVEDEEDEEEEEEASDSGDAEVEPSRWPYVPRQQE